MRNGRTPLAARLLIRAPMMHSLFRSWNLAFVTILLLPTTAAAQKTTSAKIDETLRESIDRGCAGTLSAIITVAPGHREGVRQLLAAHGDMVSGEFPAIEAIAATRPLRRPDRACGNRIDSRGFDERHGRRKRLEARARSKADCVGAEKDTFRHPGRDEVPRRHEQATGSAWRSSTPASNPAPTSITASRPFMTSLMATSGPSLPMTTTAMGRMLPGSSAASSSA